MKNEFILKPHYHFIGEGWNETTKDFAMRLFHPLYNKYVDLSNGGNFEKWNAEFSILYPDADTSDQGSEDWHIYTDFIAKKLRPYAEKLNEKYTIPWFKCGVSSEEANFILIGRWGDGTATCDCSYTVAES